MKPIDLLGQLVGKLLTAAVEAGVDAIRKASRRPPPRAADDKRIDLPNGSIIYKDEHCWTRFGPHLPPQTCIWCKQPMTTASRYCPGMPKDA